MSTNVTRRTFFRASAVPVALVALTACQSAPAEPTPAPLPAGASKLFMDVSVVQSSLNVPPDKAAAMACVMTSRFPRNSEIVWRAKIYDGKSGDALDDKSGTKAAVHLANGTSLDMKFGGHPGKQPVDYYWTANWPVPIEQPTGTLNYTIAATAADGRTAEYKPIPLAPSLVTITEDTLETIPTPVPAAASATATK